ncbi:hypothetical protein C3706_00855 [Faecalibacterium prausnitzii]|uniref:Lipoprotein n=2 Tax=Faecalibacterium prausnitzii TaxID=853 RepID=A0AAX1QNA1_9FIRM|nr:hypothetical protein C3706_00855 [Faecalibacterium prausnitzii]RAW53032.1 hypothetical protein C4N27_02480 [Faecalibacterium prausnitzii]
MEVSKTPKKKEDTTMKLKKLLALALAGVLMLALLTGCSGGASGTEEDRLVAEAVADIFKGNSQNVEVSYSVPALTRTIRPAFTPDWFQKTPEGIICGLDKNFPIDAGQTLEGFLRDSLKAYEQSNFVSFVAFDSTGMSALQQVERFSSGAPVVGVYYKDVSPTVNTKLRVGVCHKTVDGREYCLVVIVRAQ